MKLAADIQAIDAGDAQAKPKRRALSNVNLLSIALASMFALVVLIEDDEGDDVREAASVPELFDAPARCSKQGEGARHQASELERKALAKNERAPWRVHDGVEAAFFLDEARACFLAAGDAARAEVLAALLGRWQRKLAADYQRTRLQLEFAVRRAKEGLAATRSVPSDVAAEIGVHVGTLKGLLAHREGPYLRWLDKVARSYAPPSEKAK